MVLRQAGSLLRGVARCLFVHGWSRCKKEHRSEVNNNLALRSFQQESSLCFSKKREEESESEKNDDCEFISKKKGTGPKAPLRKRRERERKRRESEKRKKSRASTQRVTRAHVHEATEQKTKLDFPVDTLLLRLRVDA